MNRRLINETSSILKWIGWIAFVGIIAVVALEMRRHRHGMPNLEELPIRILLTCVGVLVGCLVGVKLLYTLGVFRKTATTGLIALVLSQVLFLTLVWTRYKTATLPWRLWWIAIVATSTATHIMWLRMTMTRRRGSVQRVTIIAAILSAALLASISLKRDVLSDPSIVWIVAISVAGAVTVLGTIICFIQLRRAQPPRAVSKWKRLGWSVATTAAVFGFGFYAGRITAPPPDLSDVIPSALTSISPHELEQQVQTDLVRLRVVAAGIDELQAKAAAFHKDLDARRRAEKREYFRPEEDDQVRSMFMTYLAYRSALLRMIATYGGFEAVQNDKLRAKCFLVGYAAGATVLKASASLVHQYQADESIRRKLNEPDPRWGMPGEMFDRIHDAVTSDRNIDSFEEMAIYYNTRRGQWRDEKVFDAEPFDFLCGRIDRGIEFVHSHHIPAPSFIESITRKVKRDAYSPVYAAQSVVSTWIGDIRMVERPPFIGLEQIRQMQTKLQPGDILLERRNWFFSNAFLPGFWPHAALYVGTVDDLKRLGVTNDPAVQSRFVEFSKRAEDGEPHTIIESVSEGVIFNSLTESMRADYVAVLRPRLSDSQKAQAIARAFSHQGKPYDFEFDFFSSDKLVCTELVYRSYEGLLHFDLVRVMGRDTLPALEIVHKFSNERASDKAQLDFILFLDTPAGKTVAQLSDEASFITSAERPRGFNE